MNRNELNEIYQKLEAKMHKITTSFLSMHEVYPFTCAYYNGHYFKNPNGEYIMDYFPIPVISFEKLCDYYFEVYGVEEYLNDFYTEGNSIQELITNISNSSEKEIGFSFQLPWDVTPIQIEKLVRLLEKEGFYF